MTIPRWLSNYIYRTLKEVTRVRRDLRKARTTKEELRLERELKRAQIRSEPRTHDAKTTANEEQKGPYGCLHRPCCGGTNWQLIFARIRRCD
jgi:hypothetical protein